MSVSVPACETVGRGPTVLLLHGIGGGRMSFAPQQAALADRYRTVAWDMPGYGSSTALTEMTWGNLAESAVVLLDQLGVERVHLVGHSMGGMVAQEFAYRYPDRLASLVLSGTSASFGGPTEDFKTQFLAARLKPLDEGKSPADLAEGLVKAMVGDDPDPEGVAAAIRSMRGIPAASYRQALNCLVTFNRRDELARIAVPTQLIAGGKDRTAPPAGMRRMAEKIRGSRYEEIPGAGHLMNLERPQAFSDVLAGFLERVT